MLRISDTEFQQELERYLDEALRQPLMITRDGRDRLVAVATEEFERLKRRDRVVRRTVEMSEAEMKAMGEVRMDLRHDPLNALLNE